MRFWGYITVRFKDVSKGVSRGLDSKRGEVVMHEQPPQKELLGSRAHSVAQASKHTHTETHAHKTHTHNTQHTTHNTQQHTTHNTQHTTQNTQHTTHNTQHTHTVDGLAAPNLKPGHFTRNPEAPEL